MMKETKLSNQLHNLCDRADKDIENLSTFVYEFIYQALSNYSYSHRVNFTNVNEWRQEFSREIENILAVLNPNNTVDLHYLICLRTIVEGEKFVCVSKNVVKTLNLNGN